MSGLILGMTTHFFWYILFWNPSLSPDYNQNEGIPKGYKNFRTRKTGDHFRGCLQPPAINNSFDSKLRIFLLFVLMSVYHVVLFFSFCHISFSILWKFYNHVFSFILMWDLVNTFICWNRFSWPCAKKCCIMKCHDCIAVVL